MSPRRQLYEAKFDNYRSNKELREVKQTKQEAFKKEHFDRFTKGEHSPSKQTYRYQSKKARTIETEEVEQVFYSPEQLVEQKKQTQLKRRQEGNADDFNRFGVTSEDKMLFFLLKWIFNAIKIESEEEDKELKGLPYVRKIDLIK